MALIDYARVSTESQHIDLQKDVLCKAGCEQVFEDIISGAKKERQGLDAAPAYLREGNAPVMWKFDRLGRSIVHLINTVQGLATCGVGLKVLAGQGAAIDTTTAPGKLVFRIFTALAELEHDLIRKRTKAGLTVAAARGRKGGRKPIVTADRLQRARGHIADGLNVRKAATRLKVSKTALYAALQSGGEQRRAASQAAPSLRPEKAFATSQPRSVEATTTSRVFTITHLSRRISAACAGCIPTISSTGRRSASDLPKRGRYAEPTAPSVKRPGVPSARQSRSS